MPFACQVVVVSGWPEGFGDGAASVVQIAGVPLGRIVVVQDADTGLVWVQTREQRCPRGAAPRRVVELGQGSSPGCEAVDLGGLDLAAEASDIGEAHVVGEDEDDIRPVRGHLTSVRSAVLGQRSVRALRRCCSARARRSASMSSCAVSRMKYNETRAMTAATMT